jgi:hypothetical protein
MKVLTILLILLSLLQKGKITWGALTETTEKLRAYKTLVYNWDYIDYTVNCISRCLLFRSIKINKIIAGVCVLQLN